MQIIKLLIVWSSLPFTWSLFDPNIFLTTQFSNTLSLRSSLNVSGKFSHPYKTTDKIVALYTLIFIIILSMYVVNPCF